VCSKCSQNLLLLPLGHLEEIKRPPKFSRDFVELAGRDLQLAMGFLQAERSTAWFRGCILLGSTGNLADPQGAHELEAWKSAQIIGVPFPEGGVLRCLADDRVLHDRLTEVINHRCDGECATEPFVQTRFRHFLPPRRLPGSVPPGSIGGSFDRREDTTRCPLLRRTARLGLQPTALLVDSSTRSA
jgi:hypothetical protein